MDDYGQQPTQDEEALDLRDYWRVVRKRLWIVLAVFSIVVVTATLHALRTRPVYRATAQILIERENPRVVKVQEVMPVDTNWADYYQTQYKVLESRALAREVIRTLRLHAHKEFNAPEDTGFSVLDVASAAVSLVRAVLPGQGARDAPEDGDEARDPAAPFVNAYLARLSVDPVRNSRLVRISLEAHDPVLAAQMANAHAQAFIGKDLEMKVSASQEAVEWLGGRQEDLRKTVQESEEALQRFQEQEDIVALESILSGGEHGKAAESILGQRLAEINANLTPARAERIGLEALFKELQQLSKSPSSLESLPQVTQSGLIQALKQNHADLVRQSLELKEKYGEKHPRMLALQDEIRSIRSAITDEIQKIAKSVEIQYKVAAAKEQGLIKALEQAKKEVNELNKKAIQYGVLKREVESNRQLYDMVLKRGKETALTSGLKSTNIFIVDRAEVPLRPVKPQVARTALLAAVIGLMLGVGLAFFLEFLDRTIHGPNEVKRYLGVPFLGPVGVTDLEENGRGGELVVLAEPRSNFAESLRTIRTNVVFSFTEPTQNSLVITSAGPQEGKTLISANLAVIMAQMGRRVLLVDGDMRRPRVHKVFGTSGEPGLSNLILGKCPPEAALRDTRIRPLKLLPAGTIPPNPSEILASRRMEDLLGQMKQQFEFVIFDSPPLLSVTDAAVLGGQVDGTILVVKASETSREHARRALDHLLDVKARVLGVVLNQVDFEKERYYYSYYYRYYQGYPDEGGKGERRSRHRVKEEASYGGERTSPARPDA